MPTITELRKISLFKGLGNDELESIQECLHQKSFDKGELLFREGQPCERIFIVQNGRVKLYRIASSGREQVLEMLGAGDTCACHSGESEWSCSSTAEAMTASDVLFLSREKYFQIMKTKPAMLQALNRIFAKRMKCFSMLIEDVSLKDTKSRLVKFLLDMHEAETEKGRDSKKLLIPFTREEIAQRLGTARETVARNLSQLKQKGLIDLEPGKIILRDLKGLQNLL